MKRKLIVLGLIISLAEFAGCASLRQDNEDAVHKPVNIPGSGIESGEDSIAPESPKLIGGWEEVSLNDSEALYYFSEVRAEIIENEEWIPAKKPYRILRQVVAGMKYHFYSAAELSGNPGEAEILILVHLDGCIEILEYWFKN